MARRQTVCWPEEFENPRPRKDRKFVDSKIELGVGDDAVETFFNNDNNSEGRLEVTVENVVEVCKGVGTRVIDLEHGIGCAAYNRCIWIDDRRSKSLEEVGELLVPGKLRTPTSLYKILKKEADSNNDKYALRRRIFICGWDPWAILALTSTATYHEAPAVKDVIRNHFRFKPVIEVKVPYGFKSYLLSFHIPYFILRETEGPLDTSKAKQGPPRRQIDLSFLGMIAAPKRVWSLSQTGFTCVVTGTDEWKWVAYGLGDPETDGLLVDLEPEVLQDMDQLACSELEVEPSANPTGRPREYWLQVLLIRMQKIALYWVDVVERLEGQVKSKHIAADNPLTRDPQIKTGKERVQLNELFTWTLRTTDIIEEIWDLHSELMHEWDRFDDYDNGNIRFFTDTGGDRPEHNQLLEEIRNTFETIRRLKTSLNSMKQRCEKYSRALELRLAVDAKNASDSNIYMSGIVVYLLTPLALGAAIFSMNQKALPFELNKRNLAISLVTLWMLTPIVHALRPHISSCATVTRTKVNAGFATMLAVLHRPQATMGRDEEATGQEQGPTNPTTELRNNSPGDRKKGVIEPQRAGPSHEMMLLSGETLKMPSLARLQPE